MKIKKDIMRKVVLTIIAIMTFCFIMKNFFPAEWSFITPHKQGDFVRVGSTNSTPSHVKMFLLTDGKVICIIYGENAYGIEIYNPKTRKFKSLKQNNSILNNYLDAVKLADDKILIFASCKNQNDYLCTYIFDPRTSIFEQGANMTNGRKYFAAANLNNGKIFIVGGLYSNSKTVFGAKTTEFYDLKNNEFEKGPDLPVEMPYMSKIVQLKNDDIYVFGCAYISEFNCEERIYKLTSGSNVFKYIDKLPCRNNDILMLKSGEIVTFCGMSDLKTVNKIIIFDPKTNKITQRFLDLPDYFNSKTVLLPDDNLFFIGSTTGFATSYKIHKEARIYNLENGDLKFLKNRLNVQRTAYLDVVTLNDNNLLIVGSKKGGGYKPFPAEIYMFNNKIEK